MPKFTREPATAIVSLGGACSVAHNLRRHFGFETSYPFDWWVTPVRSIAALLRRPEPAWLYDPGLLELTSGANSVRHAELDVLLHHDFPRRHAEPGTPVVDNYRDFVGEPRGRATHLFDRLLNLNDQGQRILFVREALPQKNDDQAELVSALAATFPDAEWSLLITPHIEKAGDWRGDPDKWDAILRNTGVQLLAASTRAADVVDLV